jgi:hypothetical protein
MITLIGTRCTCSNAFSRGVLIPRQNSRKELWESRKFSTFTCFVFRKNEQKALSLLCWWFGDGGTPVLIPNTAVKPVCADGSRKARVGRRQHRVLKQKIVP